MSETPPEKMRRGRVQGSATFGRMSTFDKEADDWFEYAKCRNLDPEAAEALFHPVNANAYGPGRDFCKGTRDREPCPVINECLAYALRIEADERYRWGLWGALTPPERARLAGRVPAEVGA